MPDRGTFHLGKILDAAGKPGSVRHLGSLGAGAVLAALAAAGCGSSSDQSQPTTAPRAAASRTPATVAYVNDGDTLRTTTGDRVRLVQIDAPELPYECYGEASLVALRLIAPAGTKITLVRDPALDAHDAYGRLLRYVFVNGTNANLALVRAGAASPYFFRGDRGRYARALLTAAAEARSARRGFWAVCPLARLDPRLGSLTGPAAGAG
jgi:endonuclease YncB( thermonuclease family)